ncbi:MAG TPA: hypothetical protein VGW10_16480 [Solirubrobacteraceae bacterium]|nr:hypothetical protein [Solirubrobacteraceae bacterium]
MRHAAHALLVVFLAALAAGLALTIDHAGEAIYNLPGYAVGIAIAVAAIAVAGAALVWRSRDVWSGVGAAVVAALTVGGLLAILSIGLVLLALAAALGVLLATRAPAGPRRGLALAGGALVGVALPLVALTALSGPLVDCAGGSSGENFFMGLESSSGSSSATVDVDGNASGRATGDSYEYEYECRGDRLVRFDLRER